MANIPYYDAERGQMQKGGKKPKFDYDSEEWYAAIEQLAKNGANNKEIAAGLKHIINAEIDPCDFNNMVEGCYQGWNDEENNTRSARLRVVLRCARFDTNRLVKATYLKTALGLNSTKSQTTVKRRLRINGELTDNEEIQTTEVVSGISPNLAALGTWLYHHDPEWRAITQGKNLDDKDVAPEPSQVKKGVSITEWLDKELLANGDDNERVRESEEDRENEENPPN